MKIGNLFVISVVFALATACQPKLGKVEKVDGKPEKADPTKVETKTETKIETKTETKTETKKPKPNSLSGAPASVAPKAAAGPQVILETNKGDITIELNEKKAPGTVKNFLQYVDEGFFNGVVFHRVMDGFMIQGGGFELKKDGTIEQKKTHGTIKNESKNGLKNKRGTIAMARTSDPHSASAQFFINHKDNGNLDYPSFDGWGYAIFGKVIKGMDVVDAISSTPTTTKTLRVRSGDSVSERPMQNVPVANVIILSAKRKN